MDPKKLGECNAHELLGLLKEKFTDGELLPVHQCITCHSWSGYYFLLGKVMFRGACLCQREHDHERSEVQILDWIRRNSDAVVKLLEPKL